MIEAKQSVPETLRDHSGRKRERLRVGSKVLQTPALPQEIRRPARRLVVLRLRLSPRSAIVMPPSVSVEGKSRRGL